MNGFYNNFIDNIIARRISIASAVLIIIFLIGSSGHRLIEDMDFFEGFYMTFITITTIGFSELTNLSTGGRIFTMAIFIMVRTSQHNNIKKNLRPGADKTIIDRSRNGFPDMLLANTF